MSSTFSDHLLNFLHTKTKRKIVSIDDIDFSEAEISEIRSLYLTKDKLKSDFNKSLKYITKNINNIPNYDSYLCHLIQLLDELNVTLNVNTVKNFILEISNLERFNTPSFSYIWCIKYLIINLSKTDDSEFWSNLLNIVNPKVKYLCHLALIKHEKLSLSFEHIKKLLLENNTKIIFHDLKSLNITNDDFISNIMNRIELEDSDLWAKIKIETMQNFDEICK